jgi:Mg2+ and Co2+ transporter CorA
LYKAYIRFVNQIYFREVSAQEQGIELYNLLQEKMKIAEQVKDLDNEISELHQYADLVERKEQDRRITIITVLGAIFLPATFLVGVFGINTMPEAKDIPQLLLIGKPYWPFWISLAIVGGLTTLVVFLINRKWKLGFKEVFKSKKSK